ncbi:hypothetical protein L9F63_011283, partial [Diploptera punctata]
ISKRLIKGCKLEIAVSLRKFSGRGGARVLRANKVFLYFSDSIDSFIRHCITTIDSCNAILNVNKFDKIFTNQIFVQRKLFCIRKYLVWSNITIIRYLRVLWPAASRWKWTELQDVLKSRRHLVPEREARISVVIFAP